MTIEKIYTINMIDIDKKLYSGNVKWPGDKKYYYNVVNKKG